MLLQLRVTVPPDRTDRVRELFESDPGTAHLAVLPGASVSPAGDLVLADVARESADGLVAALRELHVQRDGAIAITGVDAAVSSAARKAEERAPAARPCTTATASAARGTNSGPSTIAPMVRIAESLMIAIPASSTATVRKAR